jgi:hypothetical protein
MNTIQTSTLQQQAIYDLINGTGPSSLEGRSPSDASSGGSPPVYLTPEALMLYCQTRLQGIDSQVQTAMTQQQNINSEQNGIAGILQDLATDSANTTNGEMKDPQACQTLEQHIEDLIIQIQQKDPGCSQLGQLEQLHDSVMAKGTGPYTDSDGTFHGYYCSSGNSPGTAPGGQTPPANTNTDQDGTIGSDEFTTFTSTLNNINSSLGSGAEMGMIKIQSLMSDRSTAIQLTTSILQAYDDGLSKIADNIGK